MNNSAHTRARTKRKAHLVGMLGPCRLAPPTTADLMPTSSAHGAVDAIGCSCQMYCVVSGPKSHSQVTCIFGESPASLPARANLGTPGEHTSLHSVLTCIHYVIAVCIDVLGPPRTACGQGGSWVYLVLCFRKPRAGFRPAHPARSGLSP